MIKGVARHAVIVKSPNLKEFEQAIFIMSGTGDEPQVKSQAEMLSLACQLASGCGESSGGRRSRGAGALVCAIWFLAGGATVAAIMWAFSLLTLM